MTSYEWRTRRCRHKLTTVYRSGHTDVEITRKCNGSLQYRKPGTSAWKCFLCCQIHIPKVKHA